MKTNISKSRAFTLVELIIVIAVIGVLTALIMPNFMAGRIRARDAAKKTDMRNLKQALQMYYNDFQSFPTDGGDNTTYNDIPGCGSLGTANCSGAPYNGSFETNTVYMKQLPTVTYTYFDNNSNDTYVLRVELENFSDEDLLRTQTLCNPSCPIADCCAPGSAQAYYCVCSD